MAFSRTSVFPLRPRAAITHLLARRRPAAIARLVVAVVIRETVERAIWRPVAHIGEKVGKHLPAFTDRDAASTITQPIAPLRVCAAAHHVVPALPSWAFAVHARIRCSRNVCSKTSAAFLPASRECIGSSDSELAAFAQASICAPSVNYPKVSDHLEFSVGRTDCVWGTSAAESAMPRNESHRLAATVAASSASPFRRRDRLSTAALAQTIRRHFFLAPSISVGVAKLWL